MDADMEASQLKTTTIEATGLLRGQANMHKLVIALLATAAVTTTLTAMPVLAQTLKGSSQSMTRQNQEAVRYGYSFLENGQAVSQFVDRGHLVKISANRYMDLHDVSYPYARPGVKMFLDRLASQYQAACGEKMVVTSLTRPLNRQPSNASRSSVHPTGMAADLRIPGKGGCRTWLEKALLSLEGSGVIDVTRERNPPHYHVAVFTQTYEQYVATLSTTTTDYVVRRGDTLSRISDKTGVSVAQLRAANGMNGDLLQVGQKLQVPATTTSSANTTSVAASLAPAPSPVSAAAPQQVAAVTEVTHRVRRGETLWRIANRYGTTVNVLRAQNSLSDDVLQVGQLLRIDVSRN
jgi:LysM repeat protein